MKRSLPPLARATLVQAAVIGAFCTAPVPGLGQVATPQADQDTAALPEIVVTSQRRATLLKDTPVSVEAFTADRLDTQGVRGMDDLARLSPGVSFVRQGMTSVGNYNDENSDIAIRGIDSSAGTSTTAIYIDDVPIQSRHMQFGTLNAFPALFDLDRVEVLRGPQGTLFGASAEGGAVRFLQPEPSTKNSSAYARTEVGTTRGGAMSYEAGAAFGAPIVEDRIGYRLSASFRNDGGYVNRDSYQITNQSPLTLQDTGTVADNVNWQTTITLRAAMKFQLGSDTTATPSVYYQRLHINDTAAYWPLLSNVSGGQLRSGNALPNTSDDPFTIWALKIESDLGWARLTSNTSYFDRHQTARTDYTQFTNSVFLGVIQPVPGPDTSYATFGDQQHNAIEEIKLQSHDSDAALTWVAGLYLARIFENSPENIYVTGPDFAATFPTAFPGGVTFAQQPYSTTDRQIAAYGQTDWKFMKGWTATVGMRIANIQTSGTGYLTGAFIGPGTPVPVITANGSVTQTPVTPKFGLSYQPDASNLFYASISKGFRPGGINPGVGSICASSLQSLGLSTSPGSFNSDSLWSYELGAKNTLLDHRLQIDSSAFYINWKDIQQSVYMPSCGQAFAANLGQATSKGIDVSAHLRANSHIVLGADLGYTDGYYSKTSYAAQQGLGSPIVTAGNALSTTPWNLNVSGEYTFNADRFDPYVHVDYQFTSGQRGLVPGQDVNNAVVADPSNPNAVATRVLALRGGLRWDAFDASFYVNNALDQSPVVVQSRDIVGSPLFFQRTLRPRTIGLTGTYRF